jgi:hypothetical protein
LTHDHIEPTFYGNNRGKKLGCHGAKTTISNIEMVGIVHSVIILKYVWFAADDDYYL